MHNQTSTPLAQGLLAAHHHILQGAADSLDAIKDAATVVLPSKGLGAEFPGNPTKDLRGSSSGGGVHCKRLHFSPYCTWCHGVVVRLLGCSLVSDEGQGDDQQHKHVGLLDPCNSHLVETCISK
jgi:hypothetical protein